MKILKKYFLSVIVLSLLLVVSACDDYSSISVERKSNDQIDFSTYVAIGNSLTAGFQSGALYRDAQEYSFPNLLAQQMHVVDDFEQPLISEPGAGQRIQLDDDLNPTSTGDGSGKPLNADLNRPYNNLGVPGAILADFTGTDLPGAPYSDRKSNNPLFDVILRNMGPTQVAQMDSLQPTFVSFWQGNNDVLGYVSSGGEGQITPPSNFSQLYQASIQAIAATGAEAIVYNIPDVTSIPFVFLLRSQLESQGSIVFNETTQNYQLVTEAGNKDICIDVDGTSDLLRKDDFLLLTAQAYFAGVKSGNIAPPVQPQTAIPDSLVLDGNLATPLIDSELEQAAATVAQYNGIIASAASSNGFTLVDINTAFNDIVENFSQSGGTEGITMNGVTLTPVPGRNGLFSFDGVHPSNRGHGVVANISIDAINNAYGTNLEKVDISTIPEGLPLANN